MCGDCILVEVGGRNEKYEDEGDCTYDTHCFVLTIH